MAKQQARRLVRMKSMQEFVEEYDNKEIAKIKELFGQLDVKGKGKVGANDLRQIMQEVNVQATDTELQELINQLDADSDGFITFDDFVNGVIWLKKLNLLTLDSTPRAPAPSKLQRNVSLVNFVQKLEQKNQLKDLQALYQSCNRDPDGKISINDFIIIVVEMQPDLPENDIRNLIEAINTEGSGKLSFDEFVKGMHWLNKALTMNNSFHKEAEPTVQDLLKVIEAKDREIEKLKQDLLNSEKENRKLKELVKQ